MQRHWKSCCGLVVALLLLVATMPASVSYAQTMFMGYTIGVQLFNTSTNSTTVQLTFYNFDGTNQGAPIQDTLQGNQSRTYFPVNNTGTSFKGSMVVYSASTNVASISNIVAPGGIAAAAVIGKSPGSTTVRLPILNRNNSGYFTWFSVQNTGTNPANITVTYSDNTTNSVNNLAVSAARSFFQSSETHNSANFAAQLTSGQPLVATVIQENPRLMLAYTGFTNAGPTHPVFPLVNINNPTPTTGYITGIQLQNNGNSATTVTVSYQPSTAGTACTETFNNIAAGSVATFALTAFDSDPSHLGTTTCTAGQKFIGSARVTTNSTNQPLAGVVNQLNSSSFKAGAYTAFDPAQATNRVVLPLIQDRRGSNPQYNTGFNLQNVGTSNATVSCTFTNDDYVIPATVLAPGAALNDQQNGKIANDYAGSATCTASEAGAKIVAVVNELGNQVNLDQLLVYEGVNVP